MGRGSLGHPRVLTAPLLVFHSDETKSTSWVHPGTGYSIQSGHFSCAGKGPFLGLSICPLLSPDTDRILGVWSEILQKCPRDPKKLSEQELPCSWGGLGDFKRCPRQCCISGAWGFSLETCSQGAFKSPLPQRDSLQSLRPVTDEEGTQAALKTQFESRRANHGRMQHPTSATIIPWLPARELLSLSSAASCKGGSPPRLPPGEVGPRCNAEHCQLSSGRSFGQHPSPRQGGEGRGRAGRGKVTAASALCFQGCPEAGRWTPRCTGASTSSSK